MLYFPNERGMQAQKRMMVQRSAAKREAYVIVLKMKVVLGRRMLE